MRLAGRSTYNAGRVEVYYSGSWRTVCDDSWDVTDALVVCRQLGFRGASRSTSSAHHGQGVGAILLDNVQCRGREATLLQCSHRGIGVHDCTHSEDAGVICKSSAVSCTTYS